MARIDPEAGSATVGIGCGSSNSNSSGMSDSMSASLVMTTSDVQYSLGVMNISKLNEEQVSRLWHWRLMHRSCEVRE